MKDLRYRCESHTSTTLHSQASETHISSSTLQLPVSRLPLRTTHWIVNYATDFLSIKQADGTKEETKEQQDLFFLFLYTFCKVVCILYVCTVLNQKYPPLGL